MPKSILDPLKGTLIMLYMYQAE